MNLIVKYGAVAALAIAAFTGAGVSTSFADGPLTKIVVGGDPDYRPISFSDASGKTIGFDVDFANLLGQHLKLPVDYQGIAWDGIIPALQAGKINMITSIVITDDRKKVVDFTQPVMQQTIIAVVKAQGGKKNVTAADLAGMKVGVMVNTAAATALQKLPGVNPTTYNSVVDAYADLMLGRVDVVIVESVNGAYIVASQYAKKLVIADKPISDEVRLNGVALRKGDTEALKQVNGAIDKMKADGSLAAIATKWFGDASSIPK